MLWDVLYALVFTTNEHEVQIPNCIIICETRISNQLVNNYLLAEYTFFEENQVYPRLDHVQENCI